MVNEVNLHRMRVNRSTDYPRMAKLLVNAQRGRLGMRLTQNERESAAGEQVAGRGWQAKERATDAW